MDKQAALVRDEFNLNKILIVVTSVGKVIIEKNLKISIFRFFFLKGFWNFNTKWRSFMETLFF
jgi:hypothetical protein